MSQFNDEPESIDKMLADIKKLIPRWIRGKGISIAIGLGVLLWLFSGSFYVVGPDEQGVVRRLGKMVRVTAPGLHFRLPYPVEVVDTPKVTGVRRMEIGFRTIDPGPPARYQEVESEALMLTGDTNILNCQCIIQYKIREADKFLFNVRNPERTVKDATEAALRSIVGRHEVEEALTAGKFEIQNQTLKLIQQTLDLYDSGILVVAVQLQDVQPPEPVLEAFKDVASAVEDSNRVVNQAEEFRNNIVPRARGQAQQIMLESEGYKAERITVAEGDARRFLTVLEEYRSAKGITEKRMYLETMEDILPRIQKVIVETDGAGNLLNILPLEKILSEGGKQ